MHQAHTIPWNTLSANFVFIRDNPRITPRRTDLFSRGRPTQANELNHFVRVFARTISTFANTKRTKFPAPANITPHAPADKLFPDELIDKFPRYLNKKNQSIRYWISAGRVNDDGKRIYTTSHGDLADVVKVLIYTNNLPALLRLAHHPEIPLGTLAHLSWGHYFGFWRVAESALWAYTYINICAATGLLETGEWLQTSFFQWLFRETTSSMDYDAQQLPHWVFWGSAGDGGTEAPRLAMPTEFRDFARINGYLKVLFRILYLYDVVVRECGGQVRWEDEITSTIRWMTR
ncbi:hypothetical protein PAXINDRAFT_12266 [Paxillus involutus ATCC 200175]|uniref:Uncharacterized protein n=1 Tax=Paxillus involutus ATCC 200175 TaxID=664439 RepID=A0A0C9SYF7_PAXIN|nr:hypothetical protein PAXINDRAFT_12266 [Paxillus involutus ATCC 200175]